MKSFEWSNPQTVEEAVALLSPTNKDVDPDEMPRALAGGQDLLTTMKENITRPPRVVNLKTIKGMDGISFDAAKGLRIGALVTITDLAEHPDVVKHFPGLAQAALSIAVPQIRNLGTVGGNLCQRPRCWYFRLEHVKCLKKGGERCYAADGENKYHAILGGGPSHIVHPSDLAPMLTALDATVHTQGPSGKRDIPMSKLYVLPSDGGIRKETSLEEGELITEITVPASAFAAKSTYLKFKERPSLDFAMAAVAAAVELAADGTVKQVRLVLGGVAPIPWRAAGAEAKLVNKPLNEAALSDVAEAALDGATPLDHNEYKVPLTKALIKQALSSLA